MPEEDIRAVYDDGKKTKESALSVLRGENAGVEDGVRRGGGGGTLEGFGAQEEKGDAGADRSLRRREVGWVAQLDATACCICRMSPFWPRFYFSGTAKKKNHLQQNRV